MTDVSFGRRLAGDLMRKPRLARTLSEDDIRAWVVKALALAVLALLAYGLFAMNAWDLQSPPASPAPWTR